MFLQPYHAAQSDPRVHLRLKTRIHRSMRTWARRQRPSCLSLFGSSTLNELVHLNFFVYEGDNTSACLGRANTTTRPLQQGPTRPSLMGSQSFSMGNVPGFGIGGFRLSLSRWTGERKALCGDSWFRSQEFPQASVLSV